MRISSLPPLLLVAVALLLPAAARAQDYAPFEATLDELVPTYLEEFAVPGAAVAVIRDGRVVLRKGFGRADADARAPITADVGFNVGSISKTVTAWGVMQLVERSEIDLDAPVSRYLTRWTFPPSEFDVEGVTPRRLLSHTAGLSLSGYPGWGPDDVLPSLEASLSGATNGSGNVRLITEPGSEWRYSGGGYTVLQLLVEEVTGRPFDDYMRDEVLHPLGMTYSDFHIGSDVTAGSSEAFDELASPIPGPRFTAKAAAGLHTTVEELARFAAAALEGAGGESLGRGVLSPEAITLMTEPARASGGSYGLGYAISAPVDGLVLVGHNGGNRGWHSSLWMAPETGDGFVVLTNGSNGYAVHGQLRCDWIESISGTRPPCVKPVGTALMGVLVDRGVDTAIPRYRALKTDRPSEYRFSEWELNRVGYALLRGNRTEDAIAIFELNVEEYPEASNPWDSLGEAYMAAGRREDAIAAYRRSLELDPGNQNAVRMLERLGG